MKRLIYVVLMLALAVPSFAFATELDTSGLTEKQIAEIKLKAAEVKESNRVQIPTVDKANQWVEVGKNAGLALTSCAKEIGVAGDAFLNSFTGKVVFGVLIFKMMGGAIIHLVGGLALLVIAVPIWFWAFRRTFKQEDQFNEAGKKVKTIYRQPEGEYLWSFALVGIGICGASALIMLTF
jgi:hypothetical protein